MQSLEQLDAMVTIAYKSGVIFRGKIVWSRILSGLSAAERFYQLKSNNKAKSIFTSAGVYISLNFHESLLKYNMS